MKIKICKRFAKAQTAFCKEFGFQQGIDATLRIKHRVCSDNDLVNCSIDQLNQLMRELANEYQKLKGMI